MGRISDMWPQLESGPTGWESLSRVRAGDAQSYPISAQHSRQALCCFSRGFLEHTAFSVLFILYRWLTGLFWLSLKEGAIIPLFIINDLKVLEPGLDYLPTEDLEESSGCHVTL